MRSTAQALPPASPFHGLPSDFVVDAIRRLARGPLHGLSLEGIREMRGRKCSSTR